MSHNVMLAVIIAYAVNVAQHSCKFVGDSWILCLSPSGSIVASHSVKTGGFFLGSK